jgi:membrane protease YdiL (CAAX protease family)
MMDAGELDRGPAEPGAPWAGSQVLLFFCLFFLIQFLAAQIALSPADGVKDGLPAPAEETSLDSSSLNPTDSIQEETPQEPAAPVLTAEQARPLFLSLSIGNLTLILLILLYTGLWQKRQPDSPSLLLGRDGTVFGCLKSGFLACLVWIPLHLLIALLWGGLLQALGHEIVPQQAVSLFLSALENDQSLLKFLILVNVVAIAPWVEELLFRGLLFRWLLGYRSVLASAILSGVFFGVIHDALTSIVPIACLGVALAWLYHRTGSLLTSIVFHTAFNTLMVLLMFGAKLNGVAE